MSIMYEACHFEKVSSSEPSIVQFWYNRWTHRHLICYHDNSILSEMLEYKDINFGHLVW